MLSTLKEYNASFWRTKIVPGKTFLKISDSQAIEESLEKEKDADGVEYLVKPEYVSGEEIYKHAKNSCNMCWGKGYKVLNLEKRKFPNPKDYILLAQQPLNDLTEEQKKILVEREKLSKMWRILLPCSCAIKSIIKKDKHLFVSVDGNICFRINYEVKAN